MTQIRHRTDETKDSPTIGRRVGGWDGSLLFSVLFSLVNLGWFGLNTEVGAEILAGITHSSVYPLPPGEAVSAAAGVVCLAKPGEPVTKGQPALELRGDDPARLDAARAELTSAIDIGDEPPPATPLVLGRVGC